MAWRYWRLKGLWSAAPSLLLLAGCATTPDEAARGAYYVGPPGSTEMSKTAALNKCQTQADQLPVTSQMSQNPVYVRDDQAQFIVGCMEAAGYAPND